MKDARPIWRQVEEEVERMIGLRILGPGDALPSVRELSKNLKINPATVSKAYRRLQRAGWLEVRRGEGTFVAPQLPTLSNNLMVLRCYGREGNSETPVWGLH